MLNPKDTEDSVTRIWNTILSWLFPAEQGYSIGPEFRIADNANGTVGRADLIVQEFGWRKHDDRRLRCNFAILECKRPKRIKEKDIWTDSETQIQTYLAGTNEHSVAQFKSIKRWGAIAIGTTIRFYSHGGGRKERVALWQDTLGKSTFDLKKDYEEIQEAILNIKENQHRIMTEKRRSPARTGLVERSSLGSFSSSLSSGGDASDTSSYHPFSARGRSPGSTTQPPYGAGSPMSYELRSRAPSDPHANHYQMPPQPQSEQIPYRSRNFSSSPLAYSMYNYEDEYEQRHRRR